MPSNSNSTSSDSMLSKILAECPAVDIEDDGFVFVYKPDQLSQSLEKATELNKDSFFPAWLSLSTRFFQKAEKTTEGMNVKAETDRVVMIQKKDAITTEETEPAASAANNTSVAAAIKGKESPVTTAATAATAATREDTPPPSTDIKETEDLSAAIVRKACSEIPGLARTYKRDWYARRNALLLSLQDSEKE